MKNREPFWGPNAWPVAWQLVLGLVLAFGLSWLLKEPLYDFFRGIIDHWLGEG